MALRTLAEKIGLPQYASMAKALGMLSRQARATFCNDFWQRDFSRVRLPDHEGNTNTLTCSSGTLKQAVRSRPIMLDPASLKPVAAAGDTGGYSCLPGEPSGPRAV